MNNDMTITDPIKMQISLPRGNTLELDATPQFLDIVKDHFGLYTRGDVTDDHLRMYVWGAFKNALDKAGL